MSGKAQGVFNTDGGFKGGWGVEYKVMQHLSLRYKGSFSILPDDLGDTTVFASTLGVLLDF